MSVRKMKDSCVELLDKIPVGWELKRFKFVATSFQKGNGITKDQVFDDGDVPCVRYGEIYSRYGVSFDVCSSRTKKECVPDPIYVYKGDIVFACTGELVEEIGKNILYEGDVPCVAGGDILVARHNQNPRFLNYYLNCYSSQFQKSRGKAKLKVVHSRTSDIANLIVALPPLPEQRRIAAYLDDRCARIDSVIETTKKTIEDYKALKQSIVFEAVTGKNAGGKMKDSGIVGVGKIPAEWEIKRFKFIASSFQKGNGITKDQVFDDGDVPCVRYGEIYSRYSVSFDVCASRTKKECVPDPVYVYRGDIVFACTGELVEEIGKNILYEGTVPCVAGGDILVTRHNQNPKFMNYYLNCYSSQFQKSRGKAKLKVVHSRTSDIANLMVALPSLTEQKAIADYLDKKCATIDSLIAEKLALIADLEAYKKSLIFECVTGKRQL